MDDMDELVQKLKDLFEKTKISPELDIKTILFVLDETREKESYIFDLVQLLHERTAASFTFLLAVRGYRNQAKKAGIELETLPELVNKLKTKFIGYDDLFDLAFIPAENKSPIERIDEMISKQHVDLLVIPVPFTMFAEEEKERDTSLGNTIDHVITSVLFQHKIPVLLIRRISDLPITRISLLLRESTQRREMLGWLLLLTAKNATINLCCSAKLNNAELERISLYHQVLKNWAEKEKKNLRIYLSRDKFLLKGFCEHVAEDHGSLVAFQSIKKVTEDIEDIIYSLCFQQSNVLILPPLD